ncbi:hypothetical protein REPUB_Repub17cG0004300 [Reevesia pubescens]
MAMELCQAETIPRISFSHDFCSSMEQNSLLRSTNSLTLNSSIDFNFDVRISDSDQEYYYLSADELFSHGKILPLQIKKEICPSKQEEQPPPQKTQPQARYCSSKDQNQSSKSFWQFKRSSSLNKRRLSLCPFSTLLSKSSSTGLAPKVKSGPVLKDGHANGNHRQKQNYQRQKSLPCLLQSSTSNQKPPNLKKSFTYGSHGNGVTVNPILNVPLVDVFCVSSVFLTGKDKKK